MTLAASLLGRVACPSCRGALETEGPDVLGCRACSVTFRREGGAWRMLAPGREAVVHAFTSRYEAVRAGEGRRVAGPRQLDALPFRDLSGARRYEWSIRATSFRALLRRVVRPAEREHARPLVVLDLGSGVGWLAHRLARRGHRVVAVDLVTNVDDGLGAHRCCEEVVLSVQAEFDRLPLASGVADLAIFNASLHYAVDYGATLREALRVLRPDGRLVILDSPLYADRASGEAMLRERGHSGLPYEPEGFLTDERVSVLGRDCAVAWEVVQPWYGVRWWLRPAIARLRGRREPARFTLLVGRREGGA